MVMDTIDQIAPLSRLVEMVAQERIPELSGDNAPWEVSVVEMGKAVRDHVDGDLETAICATRDHLQARFERQLAEQSNRLAAQLGPAVKLAVEIALKPIREEVECLKKLIDALPLSIRAAVEGVPEVIVQTPRRKVEKHVEYDVENKPVRIVETEVVELAF